HVDVEDVGAGLHLLASNAQGLLEVPFLDEPGKAARTGDIGPLADHDEVRFRADDERLLARQGGPGRSLEQAARLYPLDGLGNGMNPLRVRTAAAAHK